MRPGLQRALARAWRTRGALALILWPASVLYGLLVRARRGLYQSGLLRIHRASVPVVVVGNVVAGGGGKTPVVVKLVQHLQSRGLKVGVVSRGYGRHARDCRAVLDDSLAEEVGDEPMLVRRTTGAPVFVAPARIDAARALIARHPDVDLLVCDDGLQHYGLHRDVEICVFDESGLGNGFLLPAGPMREAWPRPVDLILRAGKAPATTGFSIRRTLASYAHCANGTTNTLEELTHFENLADQQLWAVAGIARPEAFFAMLRAQGLPLAHTEALSDHADFSSPTWSGANAHTLVCTEKDAMKLWRHRPDALAVPLVLEIDSGFWEEFDKLLATRGCAKLSFGHGTASS